MDSNSRPPMVDRQRSVIAVGLLAIGLIHTLDLPSKLHETPYLGMAYVVLIAASLIAAIGVVAGIHPGRWLTPMAVGAGPLAGYVLSRSIGLPGATGDIGNWLEPLGLASMFVESAVVLLVAQTWIADRPVGTTTAGARTGRSILTTR